MNLCEVQFVGAAGTVTGSKHLLTIGKPVEEPEVGITAWEQQIDTKSKLIHSLQTKHLSSKQRKTVKKQLHQVRTKQPQQQQQEHHQKHPIPQKKNVNIVDEESKWTTSEQMDSSSSSEEDEEETEEEKKESKQQTSSFPPIDFDASLNILIDCGMYQGDKEWKQQNWQPIPSHFKVEPNTDAVIVTHGHIDHVGYLPRMVQQGFKGAIYCSPRSFQLMQIVLPDAAQLQQEDADYANQLGDVTSHKPALPFFTMEEVEQVFCQVEVVPYHEKKVISKNGIEVAFEFFDAGHLLGSCYVQLWLDATALEKSTTMLFSGDIGTFKRNIPLQTIPEYAPIDVDYIVSESTYGNVSHLKGSDVKSLDDLVKPVFKEAVNFVAQTKGVILIPAFSIGRSQHVAFILLSMMEAGEIPTIPVHIDSPMASKALQLYVDYMLQKGDASSKRVLSKVHVHESLRDSKILQNTVTAEKEPRIVISSSGMLSGGRVMYYAKELVPHKQNVLLLSGYQGVGTPGRLLQEGETKLKILGKVLHVHCKLMTAHGMSAHGDADDVLEWLKNIKAQGEKKRLKQCFIVHGEGLPSRGLAARFTSELHVQSIIPAFGSKFFIERRRDLS